MTPVKKFQNELLEYAATEVRGLKSESLAWNLRQNNSRIKYKGCVLRQKVFIAYAYKTTSKNETPKNLKKNEECFVTRYSTYCRGSSDNDDLLPLLKSGGLLKPNKEGEAETRVVQTCLPFKNKSPISTHKEQVLISKEGAVKCCVGDYLPVFPPSKLGPTAKPFLTCPRFSLLRYIPAQTNRNFNGSSAGNGLRYHPGP